MTSQLHLYNTEAQKKVPFTPQKGNHVTMYTCGPTVYDYAHIGNLRAYIFEDLLRRTIRHLGMTVNHVMNITDIDDKTIKRAVAQGISLSAYVTPFKEAFFEDLKTLNIEPAEHYPCATDYVDQMIEMIQKLIEKGFAYRGNEGSVYYAIDKFERYGCLSHLNLDELEVGASQRISADEYDKEQAADFVLWKAHDEARDGPIFWESPFGAGRPGWHLECSTMALHILGDTIDIHCGGIDNMFPHHENEIAQSEAYTGKRFVRYWLHAEHLIVNNKKMSKSLGNFYTLRDLLQRGYSGKQVRYMLLHTHYKTQLNFTMEGLEAAKISLQRLDDFVYRIQKLARESDLNNHSDIVPSFIETARLQFREGLCDDLNISLSLAALFDFLREINSLCDHHNLSPTQAEEVLHFLEECDAVLGFLNFHQDEDIIPREVQEALDKRNQARKEKNWTLADTLRDYITSQGYTIEDSSVGARLKKM